ncbi:MAG: hypothetical protein JHD18_08600 [Rhodoferax sp.]|nr:hypothetical protein [Rhodoferax sp.]
MIVKKIAAAHAGAHGGGWKIALADMMTAMMAFFLLMWILGATNDSQRKSVADYFKPASQSVITMGALAGSNGIMGGRSIIDPDGFPYTAKQTAPMERLTPKSEGGPTENDPSPNSENARDNDAKSQNQSPGSGEGEGGGTGTGQGGEKPKWTRWKKTSRKPWRPTRLLSSCKAKYSLSVTKTACGSRSSTKRTSPCFRWVPPNYSPKPRHCWVKLPSR